MSTLQPPGKAEPSSATATEQTERLHELRSMRSITSRTGAGIVPDINAKEYDNDQLLAEIGYKQELKRTMGPLGCFGISFSIMGVLPSIISIMSTGMYGNGPVSLLWGWFLSGFFILIGIGIPMSETVSSLPTSGGLYFWTHYFAPSRMKTALSFFIGLGNTYALATGVCSVNYGFTNVLLSAVYISNDGDFEITNYNSYGVFAASIFGALAISCCSSKNISRLQGLSIFLSNILIIIFFIALPIGTARTSGFNDAKFIFGNVQNLSSWTPGWSFILFGFMPGAWTIGSFDSCVHMSEEVRDPVRNVPIGILGSITACWLSGFCIIILINACIDPNITEILNTDSGQPMAQMFYNALGKEWAVAFISLTAVCQFFMGASMTVAVSRQAWAFARDDGLPFSQYFKVVDKRLAVPLRATWFVCGMSLIIGALILAGDEAASALFGISTTAGYICQMIPQILRSTSGRDIFRPGPFYIGKFLSPAVSYIGILFQCLILVIAMFPDDTTVTSQTMNYCVVVSFGAWGLTMAYYFIWGHKTYTGPKSNLTDEDFFQALNSGDNSEDLPAAAAADADAVTTADDTDSGDKIGAIDVVIEEKTN